MSSDQRPRPRAFRLDGDKVLVADGDAPAASDFRKSGGVVVAPSPDAFAPDDEPVEAASDEQAVEIAQKRGLLQRAILSWGGLFWSALGGLVSLGFGLWATRIVDDLFARSAALGWIGVALAAVLLVAALGLFAREARAVFRQRRIAHLHLALAQAREQDDRDGARKGVAELVAIYTDRPDTARSRNLVNDLLREIVDAPDLLDIAERNLMRPLDDDARREIAAAAKRVSVVTAISPRALVDVAFVAAQAVRLLRRISEIYGGRPGLSRLRQAGALGRRASGDHRRHGGRRLAGAAGARPRHRRAPVGAPRRRRAQRHADDAHRPLRHGGMPADALRRGEAAGRQGCRAVPVQRRKAVNGQ